MKIILMLILNQVLPGFETCQLTPRANFGAYFIVGNRFGFAGSFKTRLGHNFDAGLKPAFLFKGNGNTKVGIGVDGNFKFHVFKKTSEYPFNVSIIPHSGIYFEENLFHFSLLTDVIFDFPIPLENRLYIVPYVGGGLGMGFESKEKQGERVTDVYPSLEIKMGFLFRFTKKTGLFTEIFLSSFNTAFGMGINFEI